MKKEKQADTAEEKLGSNLFSELADRNQKAHKHNELFNLAFWHELRFSHYWNAITGFDVVKLDDNLKVPNGTSTAEFIEEKYGKKAVELVRAIMAL